MMLLRSILQKMFCIHNIYRTTRISDICLGFSEIKMCTSIFMNVIRKKDRNEKQKKKSFSSSNSNAMNEKTD